MFTIIIDRATNAECENFSIEADNILADISLALARKAPANELALLKEIALSAQLNLEVLPWIIRFQSFT